MKPAYEQAFPAKALADIEITGRDGQIFVAANKQAIWEPPDTLPSDDELEAKFRWLVEPLLGPERTAALIELIWHFEQVGDGQKLLELTLIESRT